MKEYLVKYGPYSIALDADGFINLNKFRFILIFWLNIIGL
jgi:hypothetical protein